MSSNRSQRTQWLREAALRHGFMGAGISRAGHMDEEAGRLEAWLHRGYHGEMGYMANHFDLRVDPTKLVPGAKSVISLMYNYYPAPPENQSPPFVKGLGGIDRDPDELKLSGEEMPDVRHADARLETQEDLESSVSSLTSLLTPHDPSFATNYSALTMDRSLLTAHPSPFKISRYAYGEDYHKVVRRKLKALVRDLKNEIGDCHARVFVDSAPVLERDWAKRSGQGWIGKNALLIHPKKGSYFFLAEIIIDMEFDYDHPMRDHCGTCTRCIDACPTDAISPEGYVLDGSKCISYLTIELKSAIPEEFKGKMEDWIFGCDICQEVCPWNRFSTPHHEPAFEISDDIKRMKREDWEEMTEEIFFSLFEKSAVNRTGYEGLKRNITFLLPESNKL